MEFILSDLRKNNYCEPHEFKSTLYLKQTLIERFPEEIINLSPVSVSGIVSIESSGDALLYVKVKATITVPSTRSLTPVKLDFNFHFTEYYVDSREALNRYDAIDVVIVIENVIDIDKAVADNLLLQIPMQVLSTEEQDAKTMPKGNGWKVSLDGGCANENIRSVDPRLAKLEELYKDS